MKCVKGKSRAMTRLIVRAGYYQIAKQAKETTEKKKLMTGQDIQERYHDSNRVVFVRPEPQVRKVYA